MQKGTKRAVYILLPIIILLSAGLLQWKPLSYFALRKAAHYYAGRAHIAVDIGGIEGSPFSRTSFTDLSIRPAAGEPQTYHFKARSITCTYTLWDLKKSLETFMQGLSCTADGPEFSYDLRMETEQGPAGEEGFSAVVQLLPGLDVQSGTVILTGADGVAELRGIAGSLRSVEDAGRELQLRVDSLRFSQEDVTRIETGFTALLRYADAKLSIASFEVGEEQIAAAGFIDLARMDEGHAGFGLDVSFAASALQVSGEIDNRVIRVHAGTENFDIGELQKRLGSIGWDISGRIRGGVHLAYNLETKADINGSFGFDVQECRVRGVDINVLAAEGDFAEGVLHIAKAGAETPGNRVSLRNVSMPVALVQEGEALALLGATQGEFAAEITDTSTLLKLFRPGEEVEPEALPVDSLSLSGRLAEGVLHLDDARAAALDTSLTISRGEIPVPAGAEGFASLPVKLDARVESADLQEAVRLFADIAVSGEAEADMAITGTVKELRAAVKLTAEQLGFREMQFGSLALRGDIRLFQEKPGSVKKVEFQVMELAQANDSGSLALLSPADGSWQPGSFSVKGIFQADGQGEIEIEIAKIKGQEIKAAISTRNLDSDGWLGSYVDERYFFQGADMEAALTGPLKNPRVQLAGSMAETGWTGMDFPLSGRFGLQYSAGGIEISEFAWKSHERNQLTMTGFLPYDPMAAEPFLDGALTLDGHIDFPALEDIGVFLETWGIGKGSAALDVALSGTWKQPLGHARLRAEKVEVPEKLKQYFDLPMDLVCELDAEPGSIVLNYASLESGEYSAQAVGSWQHGFTVRELLQKPRAELRGEVSLDASLQLNDLNFLRKTLPWLRRFDGDTQVKLFVSGPASDPSLKGSFLMKDGEVSHTFNFPMLSAVDLQGEFDENSISINTMQGEAGGSTVSLNGKVSRGLEGLDVGLQLAGRNVLLLRNNDMRLRGDVQLEASGPLAHLVIKGTTGLTGGYYTRNVDFLGKIGASTAPVSEGGTFLFSIEQPPLKNAVFDIKITTIEPFKIRNNLVRGTLRPELFLKGTGELPYLVGTIYIDPSRVLLPSGRLQVQSGLVRFLENDPDRPQLDLLATSKVQGYDINVVTQGPLDEPVITLSSSPALPSDDLLLLLLTGQLPKDKTAAAPGTLGRGATNVMVYLGRDFLTKWLEDDTATSDESLLDRFELDYGRAVTKSGEQTIESTFRLSEEVAGKNRVYYLSGEKDRYDAFNYGLRVVFRFE